MNLAANLLRVVEQADRRVLGAVRRVDASTLLPIPGPARLAVLSADIVNAAGTQSVPLREDGVVFRQNRSGLHVLFRAPFFDAYTEAFEDPAVPAELGGGFLRLRVACADPGEGYLPGEFTVDFPRSPAPANPDSVFRPVDAPFFRAPGASTPAGWALLRVRVVRQGSGETLPGVLVRVFRSPAAPAEAPIGAGLSEWRGPLRGETLVAVPDLPRFRPGTGANVFETSQPVLFEAAFATGFTGADGRFPDAALLSAGPGPGVTVHRSDGPAPALAVTPPAPFAIRAGRTVAAELAVP